MTARWFTDCAANCPAPIDPEFTDTERASFQEILAFARIPQNRAHDLELMHCLDTAGSSVLARSSGTRESPVDTPEMRNALATSGGVRLWHNHPSQDSLSSKDWLCAGFEEGPEVLALNLRESFFVGRIAEWEEGLEYLLAWLHDFGPVLAAHLQTLANSREVDRATRIELKGFTGHVLNLALADRTNVRYAYHLAPADKDVIERCSSFGLIQDGRTFAASSIDQKLAELAAASPKPPGP